MDLCLYLKPLSHRTKIAVNAGRVTLHSTQDDAARLNMTGVPRRPANLPDDVDVSACASPDSPSTETDLRAETFARLLQSSKSNVQSNECVYIVSAHRQERQSRNLLSFCGEEIQQISASALVTVIYGAITS